MLVFKRTNLLLGEVIERQELEDKGILGKKNRSGGCGITFGG
jgi:hypothetical protein